MGKKRRKPAKGRPRVRFPKTERMLFYATESQRDRYEQAAHSQELEVAEWLRRVADEAADRVLGDERNT